MYGGPTHVIERRKPNGKWEATSFTFFDEGRAAEFMDKYVVPTWPLFQHRVAPIGEEGSGEESV